MELAESLEADWAYSVKTHRKRATGEQLTKTLAQRAVAETATTVQLLFDVSKALRPLVKTGDKPMEASPLKKRR
eukprot:1431817-Amphidinium_carterae.1